MKNKPLRICYFGTYRATYSRNQIMIAGLRANGVDVIECHIPLWQGIEDRVKTASGGWASLGFVKRVFSTYVRLLKQYFLLGKDYDVMILGYPGQLDVFLARLITWFQRKPLVLDLFMSIYLIALERNLDARSKISVRLLRKLEWAACRLPDLLICDTEAYRDWHVQTHSLPSGKFRLVPTGADDRVFKPVNLDKPDDGLFRVLYYGTFIPNHGVEYIVKAANLLKDHTDIQFELAGQGPDREKAMQLAEKYKLKNVTFTGWVDKADLPRKIAQADLLLGVFGSTPQSLMTVQNKIYEGLAMRKAVITGRAPQVERQFTHKEHLYFCKREDAESLASGVLELKENRWVIEYLAQHGMALFNTDYSITQLGKHYKQYLQYLRQL